MATGDVERETPNVWWVNQGKTFRHESAAGYFWAPLRDRRGAYPPHWRRMEEVRAGDIVLHYSDGFVRAISLVQGPPQRALYPHDRHGDYGGREGNLIYSEYHYLEPPVPREVAARLQSLPSTEHPFTSTGAVQQGYLFRFGHQALIELILVFQTSWPDWVLELSRGVWPSILYNHPVLRQFLHEIANLRLGVHQGERRRYKPLMLLAAIRTIVEGFSVAYSTGPLLRYYVQFARAIDVNVSHPEYPYFHLRGDGFWRIRTATGEPFESHGTPSGTALRGTYIELVDGRTECITDDELRPYVLGAIRTYFSDDEWSRLTDVWTDLGTAAEPPWRAGLRIQPKATENLEAVTSSFLTALARSDLRYDPGFVRSFVASLAAKPFAILTGLSGSGKTQIALQFGNWLGRERVRLVAVRPDWTGSDALFGYEDALMPPDEGGRRPWHVPAALEFMLQAARDPEWPYLLILDEMNLAHVERYFADVLSGMESGQPCLPNLAREDDGAWRLVPDGPPEVSVPPNLFIVGTVNVDETTYMFSPKVLDRANTLEFRVATDDLADDLRKPVSCPPGPAELVRGFLAIATDPDWHVDNPHPQKDDISSRLRDLHRVLSRFGFEFGHRVFTESLRFAAMMAAAGEPGVEAALDAIVMQKILPRLHGSRRRLEPVLEAVGYFAFYLEAPPADAMDASFDPLNPPDGEDGPRLPRSFAKVQRMTGSLRANQFASFAE